MFSYNNKIYFRRMTWARIQNFRLYVRARDDENNNRFITNRYIVFVFLLRRASLLQYTYVNINMICGVNIFYRFHVLIIERDRNYGFTVNVKFKTKKKNSLLMIIIKYTERSREERNEKSYKI